MALKPDQPPAPPRNPGPRWGFAFLRRTDALLPRPVFDFRLGAGTWIAVALMPAERRHSRAYLATVRGRPAGLAEVWRHFFAFMQAMMLSLRVSRGEPYRSVAAPPVEPFHALMATGRPALFGTFHLGHSDLLGFMLGGINRKVHMIRLRVENSHDLDEIARQMGGAVSFIWVNEPAALLFALKEAVQSGASVAHEMRPPGPQRQDRGLRFPRRAAPLPLHHLPPLDPRPAARAALGQRGRGPGQLPRAQFARSSSPTAGSKGTPTSRGPGSISRASCFWWRGFCAKIPPAGSIFCRSTRRFAPDAPGTPARMRIYYLPMYFVSPARLRRGRAGPERGLRGAPPRCRGREARAPAVREAIRRLFGKWVAWLKNLGLVHVTWHGPEPAAWPESPPSMSPIIRA